MTQRFDDDSHKPSDCNDVNYYTGELLLSGLDALRQQGTLCDVTLKSGERELRVHKNVISAISSYFEDIFQESDLESSEVCLDEVDADILKQLIDYMYTGMLNIDASNVKLVLLASLFLRIESAKNVCYHFMTNKFNSVTFNEYLELARKHSLECLRDALLQKLIEGFLNVFSNNDYLNFHFEFEELNQIIQMLKEKGHPEDLIFVFVMRWINHLNETRRKYTNDLLELLQPLLISPNVFHSLEMKNAPYSMFSSWTSRSSVTHSLNDSTDCILISTRTRGYRSLKIGIFSQAKESEIDFSPDGIVMGSYVCNGYYIYHQGGLKNHVLTESYVYHPTKRVWVPFVPLLEARSHHSSCVLSEKIFSFGGLSDNSGVSNGYISSVEFTDLCTGQRAFTNPLPRAKQKCRLAVHENSVFVIGGYAHYGICRRIDRFDVREGIWQSLTASPIFSCTTSCAVVGGSIYTSHSDIFQRYDIRSNEWEKVSAQDQRDPGMVFAVKNTLYGIFRNRIARFTTEENKWELQRTWSGNIPAHWYDVCTNLLSPISNKF